MLTLDLKSLEDTEALGRALGQSLRGGDLLGLAGDLGAGKTTLTRAVAAGLGVEGPILSPTFTIERRYPLLPHGTLRHWDFYRLDEESDLEELGFYDRRPEDVFVIEWVKKFPEVASESNLLLIELSAPEIATEPERRRAKVEGEAQILERLRAVGEWF